MRYSIVIPIILSILTSCYDTSKKPTEKSNSISIRNTDDPSKLHYQQDSIKDLPSSYIQSLLMSPIDLPEFKKSYGASNSGAGCSEFPIEWRHKPEKKGFYYEYMFFNKLKRKIRFLDGGPMNESELFRNFKINVYHFGDNPEFDFYDNNEVLIGIRSAGSHEALGKLNLVGKSLKEIDSLFGNDYIEKKNVRIYHYNKRVLSLQFKTIQHVDKVESFIYLHLSRELDASNIPDMLLNFIIRRLINSN